MKTLRQIAEDMVVAAYRASVPVEMGWLHEQKSAFREDVLLEADFEEIADGVRVRTDYVIGRMVKARFVLAGTPEEPTVSCYYEPHNDYQSWAGTYPSYQELLNAAR